MFTSRTHYPVKRMGGVIRIESILLQANFELFLREREREMRCARIEDKMLCTKIESHLYPTSHYLRKKKNRPFFIARCKRVACVG